MHLPCYRCAVGIVETETDNGQAAKNTNPYLRDIAQPIIAVPLRVSLLTLALVIPSDLRGNRLVVEFGLSGHDGPAFAIICAALQASAPPPVVRMKPWSTVLLASLLAFNLVVAIDATSIVLVVPVR